MGSETYILTDQAPQHALRVRDQIVETHDLGPEYLPPAERQQAVREFGSLGGRLANLVQADVGRIGRLTVLQKRRTVTHDHGKEIIEIVRHAAGNPPETCQLLGLAIVILQLPVL